MILRATIFTLLMTGRILAADLRITDSGNTTVQVRDVIIDYSTFSNDKEKEGIRIVQGDATILVKWDNIESLTISGRDDSVTPSRLRVDIVTKRGQKQTGILVRKGKMRITGQSELGDYAIDIDKIKVISPVATTRTTPS